MEILNEEKSILKIIDYINEKKESEKLSIHYYRDNNVIAEYEKNNQIKLTIINKTNLEEILFFNDLKKLWKEFKWNYLNNKKSNSLIAEIEFSEEGSLSMPSIDCFNDYFLEIILTVEKGYFKSILYIDTGYSGLDLKNSFIHKDALFAKKWLTNYIINKKVFLTENKSISINKISKDEIIDIFKNFCIDSETNKFCSSEIPLQQDKTHTYTNNLLQSNYLLNYDNFKKEYPNSIPIYCKTDLFINCLEKDIKNFLDKVNSRLFFVTRNKMCLLDIRIKNTFLKSLLRLNYQIVFDETSNGNEIYLYSNNDIILNISENKGSVLPEILFSFIENDMKNKLKKGIDKQFISQLRNNIKNKINNKMIDVIIDSENFILEENYLPIKIIFNDKELNILYQDYKINDIKKIINGFVENQTLSNIFNENNENKKKRL